VKYLIDDTPIISARLSSNMKNMKDALLNNLAKKLTEKSTSETEDFSK